ncbi:hypothetical protein CupriaWKF_02080 [Cupriavidus sp. WKF15]|uniref:hypothetical protein n=1 Tax=Cupriavidus sp. WKF15 TaxID=3032282 RepID=UPI0023E30740|nr:hypothetical protein [Cupriavidus sp. WKF15]WER46402.1 hypothetical protein CupriaWKF_02080 [Cupriavidus sp. WKF15]
MKNWLAVGVVMIAALLSTAAGAADFGSKGGPEPANVGEIADRLRADPYDLELLISFGTSKGGSAGHIALAIRDQAPGDDLVYSANFYADRDRKHAAGYYTDDLMVAIPKREYLFGTVSSVAPTAAFGLDFGEIYKRSVIGVRVRGVPARDKEALAAYFRRINDDFHRRARNTEYHRGEIRYDYLRLNCAKTIGAAFRYGAGYKDLEVTSARLLSGRRVVAAATANVPTEMAMKLIREWGTRGYGMDVVLYKKYGGSTYVDPLEEEKVAFKDLPNRFPSVLSLDFRREQGAYKDFDNLYAMYLLYNLGRYSVRVNAQTLRLEIEQEKAPMAYTEAAELARRNARSDSRNFRRGVLFRPLGTSIGETPDNTHLYDFSAGGADSGQMPGVADVARLADSIATQVTAASTEEGWLPAAAGN